MNLDSIIDALADRADDFLADVRTHKEARQGIAEVLSAEYPKLNSVDRHKVTEGLMAVLEEEGFFDTSASREGWEEGEEEES